MNILDSISNEHKAMAASYGRSLLAAVVAVTATGNYSADDLLKAVLAATIPVAIRFVNPNDSAFGKLKELPQPVKKTTSKSPKKK
jgi:hypothetical protein